MSQFKYSNCMNMLQVNFSSNYTSNMNKSHCQNHLQLEWDEKDPDRRKSSQSLNLTSRIVVRRNVFTLFMARHWL